MGSKSKLGKNHTQTIEELRVRRKNAKAVPRRSKGLAKPDTRSTAGEERLSPLIDSIQDEVWFVDLNGKLILTNRAVKEEFGADLTDEEIQEIASGFEVYRLDGTPRPIDEAPPLRALNGEIVKNCEEIVRTPANGVLRHRQVNAAPVRNSNGEIIGSVSVVRDVTSQKQAEESLRQSEEQYRLLFAANPNPMFVFDEETLQFLAVNDAAIKHYGWTKEEFLAMSILDIRPLEDRPIALDAIRQYMGAREARIGVLRHCRKDGSIMFMEISVTSISFSGRPSRLCSMTDITERERDRAALRESEERFAIAFHAGPMAIVIGRLADARFLDVNEAFVRTLGYSREEVIGHTAAELNINTEPAHREEILQLLRIGGTARGREATFRTRDGQLRRVLFSSASIKINNEDCFLSVFLDITERKAAEQAVAEQARLLDLSSDAIIVRDDDDRITYWNKGAQGLYGYAPEEALGSVSHALLRTDFPSSLSAIKEKLYREGRWGGELVHSRKDGSKVSTMSRWVLDRNAKGNHASILETNTDVTERKQAEQERTRLASFPILNPNPIIESSLDGTILFANPAALRLFPDLYQRGVSHPYVADWELLKDACTLGKTVHRDVSLAQRWYQQIFHYLEDFQRIRIYGTDITERKLAEDALNRANSDLEQKVAERTHELAQRAAQLRALAGELTIAEHRERTRLATVLHDHLQQLLVGAKFRLSVLGRTGEEAANEAREIEDLIDESIRSSRSLTAELSPPILHNAGLNAGLEWLGRRMADTQGLFVDLKAEKLVSLPDDITILLFQSIRELLFNVAKHAKAHSARVELRYMGGTIQATILDQGVGFDPNSLPPAGEGGRGFGLFSVRERVELFGGKLEVKSSPGKGTRLIISVPISRTAQPMRAAAQAVRKSATRDGTVHPPEDRKIRVLLADDHAVVRQGIASLLGDEPDIEIIGTVSDGQEAVDTTPNLLPDVILMDLSMPRLNGIEATRLIHARFPEIRIIGLSMFEEAESAQTMRDAGAVDYLSKSGPAADLIHAIKSGRRTPTSRKRGRRSKA